MTKIQRLGGLHWLVVSLALLAATLGCKDCDEHECPECTCECSDTGAGGEAGAASTGGDGGEAGGGVLLRQTGAEIDSF